MQVTKRTASVFTQQPDEVLLILITTLVGPAQRARRLVKSVGRGVVPVHFSNLLSYLRKTSLSMQSPHARPQETRERTAGRMRQADTATRLIKENVRLLLQVQYARGAAMILHAPQGAQAAQ